MRSCPIRPKTRIFFHSNFRGYNFLVGACTSLTGVAFAGVKRDVSKLKLEYPALSFYQLSKLSQHNMGGASGALYGILFAAAAKYLISVQSVDWLGVWKTSIERLQFYSKAQIGDRTMVGGCRNGDAQRIGPTSIFIRGYNFVKMARFVSKALEEV